MSKSRIGYETTCEKCGRRFLSWKKKIRNRFCSRECAPRGRVAKKPSTECLYCGVLFRRYGGGHEAKFCSRSCYLASNPKVLTAQGYVLVFNKQYSKRPNGQILEHRLVMEKHLGRALTRHETIHHINGDKEDNRLENLQLRNGRHGKGAAAYCADCGSRNIVLEEL